MTVHSLYPGFVKMFYTGNAHQHTQIIPANIQFSTLLDRWEIEQNSGTFLTFPDAMDVYTDVFADHLAGADGIGYAELYSVASEGADPLYVEGISLSVSGHISTGAVPYSQGVIPFRTAAGGLYRFYAMEGGKAVGIVDRLPVGDAVAAATIGFLTGDDGWTRGRDGAKLVAATSYLTKTNDALRKRYALNA